MTTATWALAVDADERAVAAPARLRAVLERAGQIDVFAVQIDNVSAATPSGQGYRHPAPRLLNRARTTWTSPVHERPVRTDRRPERMQSLEPALLRLDHLGYADLDDVRAKSQRNLDIAQAALDRIVATRDDTPQAVAYALLNLGRSAAAADDMQKSVDTFETLLRLFPESAEALYATDELTNLLLRTEDREYADIAGGLVDRLRRRGVDPRYCTYLLARALTVHERYSEALDLLNGIELGEELDLHDASRRALPFTLVLSARAFTAGMCGRRREAAVALAQLMAGHGYLDHRPALFLQMMAGEPIGLAAQLLAMTDRGYLGQVVDALAQLGEPGPAVAHAVRTLRVDVH